MVTVRAGILTSTGAPAFLRRTLIAGPERGSRSRLSLAFLLPPSGWPGQSPRPRGLGSLRLTPGPSAPPGIGLPAAHMLADRPRGRRHPPCQFLSRPPGTVRGRFIHTPQGGFIVERIHQPALMVSEAHVDDDTFVYAGIGARATPEPVLATMTKLAGSHRLASDKRGRPRRRHGLRQWSPGRQKNHLPAVAHVQ